MFRGGNAFSYAQKTVINIDLLDFVLQLSETFKYFSAFSFNKSLDYSIFNTKPLYVKTFGKRGLVQEHSLIHMEDRMKMLFSKLGR